MRRACLALFGLLVLVHAAAAESQGPYVHGVLRLGDVKVIACHDRELAMEIATGVNQELLGLKDAIVAAPDDAARITLYMDRLYPTESWQRLMNAIYTGTCDLLDRADHTSKRTLLVGPPELAPLSAAHSVVESELALVGGGRTTVWIITTQPVPPVEP